jgi:protein O-mannosyl-transferase
LKWSVIYSFFMKRKKELKQRQVGKMKAPESAKVANQAIWKYYIAVAIVLLISFFVYLPVLHNGLLSWDDDGYIKNNPLIYTINLKEYFYQYVMGNYHPVTILTLATEYHFFGLNATGYHTVNLLLHLLNVILVFYTVFLLSDKLEIALVASLLFGIHPMHVESVAWAAELKDLLYTFFFLSSYIFYLKYLKNRHKKFYIYALLLFLVSLLSKAMAASLPVVLLLTDYFKGRKISLKAILEKVPFFLLAIAFGVVAVLAQKSSGTTFNIEIFTFPQRLIFAFYGFITYLFKLVFPLNLSAFYPYPVANGENIPIQYYAYILLFLGLVAYVIYSLRSSKKIFFGIGFFAITIFLVLQLLPVGNTVMADRYSYIPSIGIFYLAGEGFNLLWSKKFNWVAIILLCAFTIFFSAKTYTKCGVWENNMTLWNDVISQNQNIALAYYGRGVAFKDENKINEALNDYSKAIQLNPDYADAYYNRGALLLNANKIDEALNDFNKAIQLNPGDAKAYSNRGALFLNANKIDEALNDFNNAIQLNPHYADAYYNRGNVFYSEKKYEEAISNYSKAIELKSNYAEAYFNRGVAEFHSGKKDAACLDMKQAANFGYKPAAAALSQFCK